MYASGVPWLVATCSIAVVVVIIRCQCHAYAYALSRSLQYRQQSMQSNAVNDAFPNQGQNWYGAIERPMALEGNFEQIKQQCLEARKRTVIIFR